MDRIIISMTDRLAGYVRMGDEEARTVGLAQPTAEDVMSGLTGKQLDSIRRRVQYTEYEGREGLKKLADSVKARGRRLLGRKSSAQ